MARGNIPIQLFNRGRISKLALARTDLDRTAVSAETQTNWIPRTLGSMMLRPGLGYIGAVRNSSTAVLIPFVYASTQTALLELTGGTLQIWSQDAKLTRAGSTAVLTNGGFGSSLTGWTDADESGSTSYHVSSTDGDLLGLVGTKYARAKRRQSVSASSGTHGLSVDIFAGRVNLRIGSSAGGDDYFTEAQLRPGVYSLAVASTGSFHIELSANTYYPSFVNAVSVESSGVLSLATPWPSSALGQMRWDQSADVVFAADGSTKQRRIERYGAESWGVAEYDPEDGPFRGFSLSGARLTASTLNGQIELAADRAVFRAGHRGSLIRHTSVGQAVSVTPSGNDQWSNPIRVSGVDDARKFQIVIAVPTSSTAGYDATIEVQRSVGSSDNFSAVTGLSYPGTTSVGIVVNTTHDDELDNQIIYYRIGVDDSYAAGSPTATLSYSAGGITGVARITTVNAATSVTASVLMPLGSTTPTDLWEEGSWSPLRGFPSATALHEGRLWWAGKARIWGSISDAYESFDPDFEGDAGPINRSIGSGGVDRIESIASLGRLIVLSEVREIQVKTGSLEEPLTPTNFNLRDISQHGSAPAPAVKIDKRLLFPQKSGSRVMEIGYAADSLDYETADRTVLVPEIGEPSVTRMAVQRQPDTRLHCVKSDGTVAVLVSEPAENVVAWIDIETDGAVEDAVVLPGALEDSVYYVVRREINGGTVRNLEKWATEHHARGGSSNRMADSYALFHSSGGSTTLTGATHLIGETVTAWGSVSSGVFLGSTFTVSSDGTFDIPSTLAQGSSTVCYGLPYTALFRSAKLAYAAQAGTALTQKKKVDHLGLIMADIHASGLQYGQSTGDLFPIPIVRGGAVLSSDTVSADFDQPSFEFPGRWDTDSRFVLYGQAPKPATVLGAVIGVDTKEKI